MNKWRTNELRFSKFRDYTSIHISSTSHFSLSTTQGDFAETEDTTTIDPSSGEVE